MKLIKLSTSTCVPCKVLDAELTGNSIPFENLYVDQVEAPYKIRGVPTLVVLDSDGVEMDRYVGQVGALAWVLNNNYVFFWTTKMKNFLISIIDDNNGDTLSYYEEAETVMEAYDLAITQAEEFCSEEYSITVQQLAPKGINSFWYAAQ